MKPLSPLILSGIVFAAAQLPVYAAAQLPVYAAPHFKTMDDVYRLVLNNENVKNFDVVLAGLDRQCEILNKHPGDASNKLYDHKCRFGKDVAYIGPSHVDPYDEYPIQLDTDMSQFNKILVMSTQLNGKPSRNGKYSYSWGSFYYYAKLEIDEVNPKLLHFYIKEY